MTSSNTSSEVEKKIIQCFVDTELQHDEELTLFDTDETIKRIADLLHQSEIKAELNTLRGIRNRVLSVNFIIEPKCDFISELDFAIKKREQSLNQMKGKE